MGLPGATGGCRPGPGTGCCSSSSSASCYSSAHWWALPGRSAATGMQRLGPNTTGAQSSSHDLVLNAVAVPHCAWKQLITGIGGHAAGHGTVSRHRFWRLDAAFFETAARRQPTTTQSAPRGGMRCGRWMGSNSSRCGAAASRQCLNRSRTWMHRRRCSSGRSTSSWCSRTRSRWQRGPCRT